MVLAVSRASSTVVASCKVAQKVAAPRLRGGLRSFNGEGRACCTTIAGSRRALIVQASRGNSGLLDNDTITTPGKSTEGARKKPPIYKVMLHNDNYNRREYVVKVLLKVVEGMTVDDAVVVMQEAHENGVALVVACAQDQAETYVEDLRLNGLISTMEPGH